MLYCCYPTTAIAIDDDSHFLEILTHHTGITNCIPYTDPQYAIASLNPQNSFQRIQSRLLKTIIPPEQEVPEDQVILCNLHGLHKEIYNEKRFTDVSVLIVDYYMDGINGIEVCQALANHPVKKILLTSGKDKEQIAIDAFNKGIIHRFISKASPDFINQLKNSVAQLKEAYFRDLSLSLSHYLPTVQTAFLQNEAYISLFENIKNQFNAIEYYLLDTNGSTLFINRDGHPTWLVIKQESELNDFEVIARDQEASENLLKRIANREAIPFFFTPDDYQYLADEWDQFIYPAYRFSQSGVYYTISLLCHYVSFTP